MEAVEREVDEVREDLGELEVGELLDSCLVVLVAVEEHLRALDDCLLVALSELLGVGDSEDVEEVGVFWEQLDGNLIDYLLGLLCYYI